MAVQYRKLENGMIEARSVPGSNLIVLNVGFRVHGEHRVDIVHVGDLDNNRYWWIIKNPQLEMLNDQEHSSTRFGLNHSEDADSETIRYNGVVYMSLFTIEDNRPFLLNEEGRALAGSNTYENGALCLGLDVNPYNLSSVDALLYNCANDDLGWFGRKLHGVYLDEVDKNHSRIFNITTWPCSIRHQTIPPEVIAAGELLLPT